MKKESLIQDNMMSDSGAIKDTDSNMLLDSSQEKFVESMHGEQEQAYLPGITPPVNNTSLIITASGNGGNNNGGGIPPTMSDDDEKPYGMPLLEHLSELRKRLTKCIIVIGVVFITCYKNGCKRSFEQNKTRGNNESG